MDSSSFEEGALALARLAFKNARGAPVNADVASEAKRTLIGALPAIPRAMDPAKEATTCNLAVAISAAKVRRFLSSIPRECRQTIFELWRADLTYLEGETASGGGRCWSERASSRGGLQRGGGASSRT